MVGKSAGLPFVINGQTVAAGNEEVGAPGVRCSYFETGAINYAVEVVVLAISIYASFVYGVNATTISVNEVNVGTVAKNSLLF
jgi:hypothetical protein